MRGHVHVAVAEAEAAYFCLVSELAWTRKRQGTCLAPLSFSAQPWYKMQAPLAFPSPQQVKELDCTFWEEASDHMNNPLTGRTAGGWHQ